MIVIVAQFLRHPPAAPAAAKAAATGSRKLGQHQYTTSEMLRTPQFYVLYAMFLMMATGGLLVTANAGPMAKAWGIPAAALALAASLSADCQRRQPGVLGLGVGQDRPRDGDGHRLRAAGGVPVAGRSALGHLSGTLFAVRRCEECHLSQSRHTR